MSAPLPANEILRLKALEHERITDTDADESFDRLVRLACALLDTPIGLISLVDSERQWFKARQGVSLCETPRDHAFCAHAILADDVMVVEDASKDPRFAQNPLVTVEGGIRFYAGAPLKTREGYNIGTLCAIDRVPRALSAQKRALLADLAATVVHVMELRRRSGLDELTGLASHRFIEDMGRREMSRAARTDSPFTAMLIEVDGLANIGLEFGSAASDAVLRAVAARIASSLRGYDQVGRFDQNSFVAILPQTGLEQGAVALERLRRLIAEVAADKLAGPLFVTASIGAAQSEPGDQEFADVVARAGKALAIDNGSAAVQILPPGSSPDPVGNAKQFIDRLFAQRPGGPAHA